MIKALCINDKDKPTEIHADEWIEQGVVYHITHVYYHPAQAVQGVELKEVKLTSRSKPYETYNLKRFAIPLSEFKMFAQLIKDCNDLNDVDISELLEQLEKTQTETA